MEFGFLFWLFLIGIGIASLQDLKRREVDNWLNLLLLFSGIGFLVFSSVFKQSVDVIVLGIISLLIMFVVVNIFYYGRVFAGGDAKLMFAMFALFVASTLNATLMNIGMFILFLMLAGSVYGLTYSLVLFFKNFEDVKKEFKEQFKNIYLRYTVLIGIGLFVLSYVDWIFLVPAIFFLFGPILYVFAKSLEGVVMTRMINVKNLREGDWIVSNVKIGKKVIRANWEGLTKENLKELQKRKKKVKIKEGLPFVPAFLLAFILWWFRDFLVGLVV